MEEIKNDLLKGKTAFGEWYVRPLNWAGVWKKENGENLLVEGNTLFQSENEKDCDVFIMNYTLFKLVEENPSLPIVPMTHYEVVGGDSGYWMGNITAVEIKEYAVAEWNEDEPVIFKDEDGAEDRLIESIAEYKYNGSDEDYAKAETEAKEMWTKAIIIRIGL